MTLTTAENIPVIISKVSGAAAWLAVFFAAGAEAREARGAWDKIAGGREAGKPVLAVIGLRQQKITVYDSEGPVLQAPVSTGRRAYETPAGIFTVLQKNKDHVSNLYEDAEMPNMQRITWSGIALHGGPLPGYRASHGCVRLPHGFAERIFDLTSVGTRVVIVPDRADALPVTHPLLERLQQSAAGATPASVVERAREVATSAVSGAATAAKKADQARAASRRAEAARDNVVKRLDAAVKRAEAQKAGPAKLRAEAQAAKLRDAAALKMTDAEAALKAAQAIDADRIAAEARAREARSRAWPLSIMVSLKTQKIYVRQGFEPVLELPVVISQPGRPIGTHAFYATETGDGDRGWMVATVQAEADEPARDALDRIEIPREVSEMLATALWMGSALFVTDEAPYKETAAGTDFIIVLSDEPQGALKIRLPEPAERPVAQARPGGRTIKAYRSVARDNHFRHPLGGF